MLGKGSCRRRRCHLLESGPLARTGRVPGVPVECPLALFGPDVSNNYVSNYVLLCFIMSGIMSGNFAPI